MTYLHLVVAKNATIGWRICDKLWPLPAEGENTEQLWEMGWAYGTIPSYQHGHDGTISTNPEKEQILVNIQTSFLIICGSLSHSRSVCRDKVIILSRPLHDEVPKPQEDNLLNQPSLPRPEQLRILHTPASERVQFWTNPNPISKIEIMYHQNRLAPDVNYRLLRTDHQWPVLAQEFSYHVTLTNDNK